MKRSRQVNRVLLGTLSAGALTACAAVVHAMRVTPESYYTNQDHIPGAGYYHAPFHGFFAHPYNYYDPQRKMYFYGGQWGQAPFRSIVNISAPTPEAAVRAEAMRTDVRSGFGGSYVSRSGFGSTSNSHFTSS